MWKSSYHVGTRLWWRWNASISEKFRHSFSLAFRAPSGQCTEQNHEDDRPNLDSHFYSFSLVFLLISSNLDFLTPFLWSPFKTVGGKRYHLCHVKTRTAFYLLLPLLLLLHINPQWARSLTSIHSRSRFERQRQIWGERGSRQASRNKRRTNAGVVKDRPSPENQENTLPETPAPKNRETWRRKRKARGVGLAWRSRPPKTRPRMILSLF